MDTLINIFCVSFAVGITVIMVALWFYIMYVFLAILGIPQILRMLWYCIKHGELPSTPPPPEE